MIDLARLQRVLSPKQIGSIADDTCKICLLEGSVSAGKTLASLWKLFIAIRRAPTNGLIIIIGKTIQAVYRNVISQLQSHELFGQLAGTVAYTQGADRAKILGREVIVAGANDAKAEQKIRGLTAALIYVDEATLLPVGYWPMLLTRLRVRGARMIATTNPGPRNHWLNVDYIQRKHIVNMSVWSFVMRDNPSLEESYISLMERTFTGVFYRRFILGEWTNAEGAIFDMWDDDLVVPWVDLPRMYRMPGAGLDYGTQNASASGSLGWGEDGRLYICSEWRHDANAGQLRWTDQQLSQAVRGWFEDRHTPWSSEPGVEWLYVDPSAASMKTQLYYDGFNRLANADNDVVSGLRLISSLLASDKLKIADRCKV